MCDDSLHLVTSRPAKVGDKLVSTNFTNFLTRGFAAVGEPTVVVCGCAKASTPPCCSYRSLHAK